MSTGGARSARPPSYPQDTSPPIRLRFIAAQTSFSTAFTFRRRRIENPRKLGTDLIQASEGPAMRFLAWQACCSFVVLGFLAIACATGSRAQEALMPR